jgi:hypothetical protein
VPSPRTLDHRLVDLFDRSEDVDGGEPLRADPTVAKRDSQASEVPLDDRGVHDPLGPSRVAGVNETRRQGEDDRDRRNTRCMGPFHEGPPGMMLDICGVDNDEPSSGQPPNNLAMEDRERRPRPTLIGLVPAEECPVRVGGQHLVGGELAGSERRLAAAGGTDEHHERGVGDRDDPHAARPTGYSAPMWAADPGPSMIWPRPAPARAASASATRLRFRYVR